MNKYVKRLIIDVWKVNEIILKKVEEYIEISKTISDMEYELITEYIKLRKDACLSQQDIAEKSNLIRTTVARIENQMNSPQIKTMLKILKPLGYTLKIEKIKKD